MPSLCHSLGAGFGSHFVCDSENITKSHMWNWGPVGEGFRRVPDQSV